MSHPHEDDIGDMVSVLNFVPILKYIDSGVTHTTKTYENLMQIKVDKQIPYTETRAGDSFIFGDTSVKKFSSSLSGELNDDSFSLVVTDGKISYLFLGDNENAAAPVTILKVAHYGSSSSTKNLGIINLEVAVISVGTGNTYGHPAQSTISKLNQAGVQTYRTDTNGMIIIYSDGSTYTVKIGKGFVSPAKMTMSAPVSITPASTSRPTPIPTPLFVAPAPVQSSSSGGICDCSGNIYNYGDFPLPNDVTADECFAYCKSQGKGDIHGLDQDKDNLPCEG